ncbi:Facilitated trehalose transporter Tret1-2-like protein [Frankliniella fusca]|uniref:Facilitated trehalose transporter Tret1-2-like protein n=1 Tax=Frankliniella fusca TaxID=407009 RepID=A0AAE1HVZ7_9NEOP|nr:Facilitated trehalose transporter Tret1-2-like protein [Frankliniella fusca]
MLSAPHPVRLAAALGGKATQHVSAAVVSLLALSCGMALGWTSAAAAVEHGAQGFAVSSEAWSWVGSALTLGAVAGCAAVGALLGPLGPRAACLALAPVFLAGWALHTWPTAVWMLVLGRALTGFSFGATCVVVPIYTSEVGESAVRGALGSYLELNICVGVLVVYLLGAYLPLLWLNLCCLVVPAVFAALFVWLPDSPRWLLGRGRRAAGEASGEAEAEARREEARAAMSFYRGGQDVSAELAELEAALKCNAEQDEDVSLAAAFNTTASRKGLALAVGAMVLQQLSGIDAVTFYASQMFRDAGTLALSADEASLVMASAQIAAVMVSLLVVDNLGRRMVLVISSSIVCACCVAMGFYFYLNSGEAADHSLDWVPVLVSCVYVIGFALGLGPVPWLFVGEIFPDRVKGLASSVANASNWLCAFLVTMLFPTINDSLGVHVSFWAFGACCLVGALCVGLLYPETKGKTLDEIQDELSGRRGKRRRASQESDGIKQAEQDASGPGAGAGTERRRYGSFDASSKL